MASGAMLTLSSATLQLDVSEQALGGISLLLPNCTRKCVINYLYKTLLCLHYSYKMLAQIIVFIYVLIDLHRSQHSTNEWTHSTFAYTRHIEQKYHDCVHVATSLYVVMCSCQMH